MENQSRARSQCSSPPPTKEVLGEHLHQKISEVLQASFIYVSPEDAVIQSATSEIFGWSESCLADKITGMLMERPQKDLLTLLQNDQFLFESVQCAIASLQQEQPALKHLLSRVSLHSQEMDSLGELIFEQVSKMEEMFAPQITGMLLELDSRILLQLLSGNQNLLRQAVARAKDALISQGSPEATEISNGEKLYVPDHMEHSPGPDRADVSNERADLSTDKEQFGQHIFDKIASQYPDCAEILTGMILEMDEERLKYLVNHEDQMLKAASRAFSVWTQHSG